MGCPVILEERQAFRASPRTDAFRNLCSCQCLENPNERRNPVSAGTTKHPFRLDDDLWKACVRKSNRTGKPISEVVRERLEEWITEDDTRNGVDH